MNSIKFDNTRINEMQNFLNYLYDIAVSNPNYILSPNMIYGELMRYGLRKEDMMPNRELVNIKQYFDDWIKELDNRNQNLRAFNSKNNHPYWAQFVNGFPDEPFIKLYISMDIDHIKIGVQQLFSFISTLNTIHTSKVGQELRSDGIVVRLSKKDVDYALKIVNFINSNPNIKSGLLKPNPFVPTINGVGWMVDYGRSYNSIISDCLSNYINSIVKKGLQPNIQNFYEDYIKKW